MLYFYLFSKYSYFFIVSHENQGKDTYLDGLSHCFRPLSYTRRAGSLISLFQIGIYMVISIFLLKAAMIHVSRKNHNY